MGGSLGTREDSVGIEKFDIDGIEGIESDESEKSQGEAGPTEEGSALVAPSRGPGWARPESSPIRLSQLVGGCGSVLSSGRAFVEGDLLAGGGGGLVSVVGVGVAAGLCWSWSSSSEYVLARLGLSFVALIGPSGGWVGDEGDTKIDGTPV